MIWALHGNLGLPSDWSRVMDAAGPALGAESWRIPDLRRLGAGAAASLDAAADAVTAEVAASGDPAPILAGYSMGGRIALHCLVRRAGVDWKAAIIVSAHTGLADEVLRRERRQSDAEWIRLAASVGPDELLRRWEAQPVLAGAGVEAADPRARVAGAERFFAGWSLGCQRDLLPELAGVRCPVTWICGENDARYAAIARTAAAALPRGRLAMAAGAGHRVLREAPVVVAREILALATGADSLS